jgi:hypothetical protein
VHHLPRDHRVALFNCHRLSELTAPSPSSDEAWWLAYTFGGGKGSRTGSRSELGEDRSQGADAGRERVGVVLDGVV